MRYFGRLALEAADPAIIAEELRRMAAHVVARAIEMEAQGINGAEAGERFEAMMRDMRHINASRHFRGDEMNERYARASRAIVQYSLRDPIAVSAFRPSTFHLQISKR